MIPRLLAALVAAGTTAACEQDMRDQDRLNTFSAAEGFDDNSEARLIPEGTVPRGEPLGAIERPEVTPALLAYGRQRYDVFCSPGHGLAGYGDGMIVQRGFPAPPSYHTQELRRAEAEHFFSVITNGYGVMYSYADRVPPADRWAIIAYIRALQLSQMGSAEASPSAGEEPDG